MVRNRKETTEKSKKKPGLSTQIFIALLAGALLGVVIHYWIPSSYIKDTVIVEGVLYVIGQGFIRLMQMLVVPLVRDFEIPERHITHNRIKEAVGEVGFLKALCGDRGLLI